MNLLESLGVSILERLGFDSRCGVDAALLARVILFPCGIVIAKQRDDARIVRGRKCFLSASRDLPAPDRNLACLRELARVASRRYGYFLEREQLEYLGTVMTVPAIAFGDAHACADGDLAELARVLTLPHWIVAMRAEAMETGFRAPSSMLLKAYANVARAPASAQAHAH
jgi:hypothetical protein